MARARWATLVGLLLLCPIVGRVLADKPAPRPAQEAEPALGGEALPDAGETAPDAGVAPDAQQPTGAAYEPDQRGVIPLEPSEPEPQLDLLEAAAAPTGDRIDRDALRRFYLELQAGYGALLDLGARSPADLEWLNDSRGYHGLALGCAAGLHLAQFDLGLRFEHDAYVSGANSNLFGLDSRLGLSDGLFVPQLRLGLGVLFLSDLEAANSGQAPGTLIGLSLEPGIGGRVFLDDTLSLGGALDLGVSRTSSDAADAWGFALRLHIDLGVHF